MIKTANDNKDKIHKLEKLVGNLMAEVSVLKRSNSVLKENVNNLSAKVNHLQRN